MNRNGSNSNIVSHYRMKHTITPSRIARLDRSNASEEQIRQILSSKYTRLNKKTTAGGLQNFFKPQSRGIAVLLRHQKWPYLEAN